MTIYYSYIGDCPSKHRHTRSPTAYIEWHEWAEEKSKTHEQQQCPDCNLWVIWKRKKRKDLYPRVCNYLRENGWYQDPDDHGIWRNEDNDGMTIGAALDIQFVKDKVDET